MIIHKVAVGIASGEENLFNSRIQLPSALSGMPFLVLEIVTSAV